MKDNKKKEVEIELYPEYNNINNSKVHHPNHYNGKYECIEVMKDVFGGQSTKDFCIMNAFKYLWRYKKKNGEEDIKKAKEYLNMYEEI